MDSTNIYFTYSAFALAFVFFLLPNTIPPAAPIATIATHPNVP